jgi:hypothetical protein
LTLAANNDQIIISAMTLTQNGLISFGMSQGTLSMKAVNRTNSPRSMFALRRGVWRDKSLTWRTP